MGIAKILAPLTGGTRDGIVLSNAFAAAKLSSAHVAALFIRPDATEAVPFYGESTSATVMQEIADATKEASDIASRAARATLFTAAKDAGATLVEQPVRSDKPTASYREVLGNFADRVTAAAHLSDLIVFGALKEDDRPGLTEAFEATLVETGRPVLLSAQEAGISFCKKITIAWNESAAAAHAASAALPFLKCATEVEIISVLRKKDAPIDSSELKAYLLLHGVESTERSVDGGTRDIAEVLLTEASAGGASLLVAGGYGHSRLREMFIGGVTRKVVSHAKLPVFLVH
jgi:nucleotide-binding universal stress UspA family protein